MHVTPFSDENIGNEISISTKIFMGAFNSLPVARQQKLIVQSYVNINELALAHFYSCFAFQLIIFVM